MWWLFATLAAAATPYLQPREPIRAVLNAPSLPTVIPSPDGMWLLLATPVTYPPIADLSAPMLPLAGVRIDPRTGGLHAPATYRDLVLKRVADGREVPLPLPKDARPTRAWWAADDENVVVEAVLPEHLGVFVASLDGRVREVPHVALVPMLGSEVLPVPGQLLVKMRPTALGPTPERGGAPTGPLIRDSDGVEVASSTYEARDLLMSAADEALFEHFATAQLALVDMDDLEVHPVGAPGVYSGVSLSPDRRRILVERLEPPWSYRVAWWRFAHRIEVWDRAGQAQTIAVLPAAEEVPIHGVPTGARGVHWRADADATLVWTEALDGGDPTRTVAHRDRLVQSEAPFKKPPRTLWLAQHRIDEVAWTEQGLAIVHTTEWERRWQHVWTIDAKAGPGSARPWFDRSENDRYADPGRWLYRRDPRGVWVVDRDVDSVYFSGAGATPAGDRPFVDRRSLFTGKAERVFWSAVDRHEAFLAFVGSGHDQLLIRRQSPTEVPNVHLATLGPRTKSGERARTDRAVTAFADPTPQIRGITKKIVTYTRDDGVPLSFVLYLPPDYVEGTPLPTVLYAYPREFSDAKTAGQVSGSDRTFDRFVGATHLFFLLDGYAVLHNTAMPVLGDPVTAYDTFVDQLVRDASAAIDEAVRLGVTDRNRVGIMGHSHGALMTATLLAHSDLFRAGIARSGAYNHTIRPFGFQSERRTLWEAKDTYLGLSPLWFAPQLDEPVLLVHGAIDENPGTVPLQSERLFEALRGTGGTARLVLLPHEGHGYRAQESVEHVLAEQLAWFDRYVKESRAR